ncbi:S-adenosyl-L-methionine-dependent methyltransferase [Xylariaceae sp. FL1651]|nr:S-adenosyl-L-methionine-dependent methyltransferase [Xylariaceae sp. FL1651]
MVQANEQSRSLTDHFKDTLPQEHSSRWAKCWDDNWTPWDRGGPSLALYDLLKENPNELFPLPSRNTNKTALVPGCGRGYDVLLLSSFGYDVYGLEISPGALDAAKKNASDALEKGLYEIQGDKRGTITWLYQDFFATDWKDVEPLFDLIFDYTFFCALPPPMRSAWALRMEALLKPGGRLVCLEFPSEKELSEPGPPWAAPPTEYLGYLSNPGVQPPTDKHGAVLIELIEPPRHSGLKRLKHIKPQRSHIAGTKDGRVQDYISVWTHAVEP